MKKKPKKIIHKSGVLEMYLTPQELSERLKVHVRTLSNWRDKKYGPKFRKMGHHIRYPVDGVLTWENKRA